MFLIHIPMLYTRALEWKASAKTISAWCQEHGIYRAVFYHWKNQLSEEVLSTDSFIEIKKEKRVGFEGLYATS